MSKLSSRLNRLEKGSGKDIVVVVNWDHDTLDQAATAGADKVIWLDRADRVQSRWLKRDKSDNG